jgi:hypothetical protein
MSGVKLQYATSTTIKGWIFHFPFEIYQFSFQMVDSSLRCNRIFSRKGCGTFLINTWLQPGERDTQLILKPFKTVSHFCQGCNHLAEARC